MTPTTRARKMAKRMYSLVPDTAKGSRAAAVISETMATGPVDNWRLEPKIAAINGGKHDAYNP